MARTQRILVIGDVMLDRYIAGSVDRVSPEAPVPVVKVQSEWSTLGGAANVAANVASLGGSPILVGLIGSDIEGVELSKLCDSQGIETHLFQVQTPTITKTRVVAGQQIVRIDREEKLTWDAEQLLTLNDYLTEISADIAIVLISDYAKGTLSNQALDLVMSWAADNAVRVVVDPKRNDWEAYRTPFLITPNLKELQLAMGNPVANDDNGVVRAAKGLLKQYGTQHVLVTRSAEGMTLVGEGSVFNVPALEHEIFDVSGAGDTVLATLGVCLAEGEGLKESVLAANIAAGIAVGKRGTSTVSRNEVEIAQAKRASKIVSRSDIPKLRASLQGKKIVFTNGCFDVLHKGHRKLLKEARSFGDVLIVALNSDDSIKRLKGKDRPINTLSQRISTLVGIQDIDLAVVFDEDTPLELLTELRPNILVKGGDYKSEEVVGNKLVDDVRIVSLVKGLSSTRMIDQINV